MKKTVDSKALKRKIRNELSTIRKVYAFTLKGKVDSSFDEWICDNYYILEREGMGVLRHLSSTKELPSDDGEIPRLFEICVELWNGNIRITEDSIIEYLNNKEISGGESELFELMLRCSLIHRAFEGCCIKGEQGAMMLEGAIKSIRKMADFDFQRILEEVSPVERILLRDPAGYYEKMDEQGKCLYRQAISRKAQKTKKNDEEVALEALKMSQRGANERERHIGCYILENTKNKRRGAASIVTEIASPIVVSIALGFLFRSFYVPFLLLIPLWEVLRYPIEAAFMRNIRPNELPSLDLKLQIPQDALTMITVSMLLPNAQNAENLHKKLIELWQSNGQENLKICILADLKSADVPVKPEDRADIAAAARVVRKMNKLYSNSFILAVRPRVFSNTQGSYSGWERKRGAITQLIRLIKGRNAEFLNITGDTQSLNKVKYILALDSDTFIPMDTAAELVEIALHPLNRPVVDEKLGRVTLGYGVLVPNVNIEISSTRSTTFSSIMAGEGGITAYSSHCCERYQDLFGEGIFSGKGLLDVDAFYTVLNDTLPEERILSHDILEGGYMRAGLASNVQITDGFPKRQSSYYDRLGRWIRGDWQNSIFIFGQGPLNRLSRYKLFDNLRRSITPVIACAGVLLALLMPWRIAALVSIVCLLSAVGSDLFSVIRSLVSGGPSLFSQLYYSGTTPNALAALLRCGVWITMLAQTAWVSLSSISKALWRSFVSKKNLLEWTTAAQSDVGRKWQATLLRLIPTFVVATPLLFLGGAWQRLLGVIMLFNIPFAFLSGREKGKTTSSLSYEKREKLLSYAAGMWQYYVELCNAENNYLPPDNIQETPVFMVAQRTSPTNIGMMLMCVLAARDFGFIDSTELYERLDNSLSSIERLEKWEGNLLNWYDTSNLKPLEPKYVSTVDSGNLLCCMVALRQGLLEYSGENPTLEEIRKRLTEFIDSCDLLPLYNSRRKLFHIGIDLSTGELSPSYYDLLMSEARMVGYYAIASRIISKKHWGTLGRMMAKSGRHTGPVSWTGTMFEYFMPNIFLPSPKGTLTYEALRFCLQCQRKRVKGIKISGQILPWGISESGFYAFDRQLSYQYKAHGVQKLGLKRGLNTELVISPYSSFLSLTTDLDESLKNLELLESMGIVGRCGFFEAVDYTSTRTAGQDFAVVRSYMAHHVGMSMLMVLNTLNPNISQKRFISDGKMASASCLLNEKIQYGAAVYREVELRNIPKTRERTEPFIKEYEHLTPSNPHMKLFTNREWTCGITDVGTCISLYRGVSILRHSGDLLRRPQGVFALVKSEDTVLPAVRSLDYRSKAEFKAEFQGNEAKHEAKLKNILLTMQTAVHSHLPCEQRKFTIKNLSENNALKCDLVVYFEPSLATPKDEEAHPAFSKLFLEDSFDKMNGVHLFNRRSRSGRQSLCLAVGFVEKTAYTFEANREKVLKCGYGMDTLLSSDIKLGSSRGNPDTCAAFCIPVRIAPKESKRFTLLFYASTTKTEAVNGIIKIREERGIKNGAQGMFNGDGLESVIGNSIVPQLFYNVRETNGSSELITENKRGTPALWSLGISGDYPIIFIEIYSSEDVLRTLPYVRINKSLRSIGIFTDVVIAYRDAGEYDAPIISAIREMLKNEGSGNLLNVNGGVFAIDISKTDMEIIKAVMAATVFIAPTTGERFELPEPEFIPFEILTSNPVTLNKKADLFVKDNYFTDNEFVITKKESMPSVPWSLVLCNHTFGTLVSDKALGFTWAVNSRENKLTPWFNDSRFDNKGEMLILKINGKYYDLLMGSSCVFTPESASWYSEAQGMRFEVNVKVPHKGMAKLCRVKITNNTGKSIKCKLAYYCEPVLGVNSTLSRMVQAKTIKDGVLVSSSWSNFKGYCALCVLGGADFVCCDRTAFLSGNWQVNKLLPLPNPCAAVGKNISFRSDEEIEVFFSLSWGANENAAVNVASLGVFDRYNTNSISIDTPDKSFNHLINTWLPAQILKSRFMGRTGFYQCGGAWGFRDQLQDASALILTHPQLVKSHIIRCCAVQFEQGDVLHWWHSMPKRAGGLIGVRTRYSDDLLWLPFVTGEYIEQTQDYGLLSVLAPYISGEELAENEHERYFHPTMSHHRETVYEHCIKAVDRSLKFGEHGLPLIGGGDWNDGFNKVGIGGRGESVWLAQFMLMVLEKASLLCRIMEDGHRAEQYNTVRLQLAEQIDKHAWNGDRYIRAFYDDGTPMGITGGDSSKPNTKAECSIDSLTQSFATLAGMPDEERKRIALDTAVRELVDKDNHIIKLLAAPFSGNGRNAGYIAAYPQGIRENGGQYTHAAVWLCMALIRAGRSNEGYELLKLINPAEISNDNTLSDMYRAEPYALAGDVSSANGIEGRAGWTLYTGSAAWYYRAVKEELLGIIRKGERLYIKPRLPSGWDKVKVRLVIENAEIIIELTGDENSKLSVDGNELEYIPLDGKNHYAIK